MDIKFHNPDLTSAKIMMIDDEPINMEIVQVLLEEAGYSNFVLEDQSLRAMQTLEETQPDMLILDLIMPDKDGFEILEELRQNPKYEHLPVIILTSANDNDSKLRVLELGATDLLAKPVDQTELILRVHNTLSSKSYLDQLAFYDPVTHLPNSRMFQEHFEWALKKSSRHHDQLAILNISLDDFGRINAAMGHQVGDEVLQQAADLIQAVIRNSDVYGSVGGAANRNPSLYRSENGAFMLLLERINRAEDAALVAERITQTINQPLTAADTEVYLTCSIGIVTYPAETGDANTLIRLANTARDYVKTRGGNAFQFSSTVIDTSYKTRIDLESRLRKALDREEFQLFYQPKVSLRTGEILGAEALIRWFNGDNGMISPFEFIPIAEETGIIIPIGKWVLETTCKQLKRWNTICRHPISLSANVSARQFQDDKFVDAVQDIIRSTAIAPERLTLEITESLLMQDIQNNIQLMKKLKSMGLKLSIDDFGTGYSSLSYLKNLPVDELKIDRSFIMDVPEKEDSCAIVSTIIYLAQKLGFETVAEGIETPEQLQFLKNEHCMQYQGFFFSKPVPASELTRLLLQEQKESTRTAG